MAKTESGKKYFLPSAPGIFAEHALTDFAKWLEENAQQNNLQIIQESMKLLAIKDCEEIPAKIRDMQENNHKLRLYYKDRQFRGHD